MTTLMGLAPTINAAPSDESAAWQNVSWMEQAACAGRDPELWFTFDADEEATALAVCRSCPVLESCLEDAMHEEGGRGAASRFGIRGGLLPNERFNRYKARAQAERRGAA
ncbi:WhiB family transcriptional regulator [Citricoccus sp. NPDC055426]|uniref:WhiB family transcriptional regulator n=1 Tax=Citricoccus sp. NPDC055426 TaxID=3155536 RepID=UPI003446948B